MDTKNVRKYIRTGVTIIGGIGVMKIVKNLMPYNQNIFGMIACETAAVMIGLASQELICDQVLKCEAFIDNLANGGEMVIF